ncbi:Ankyrin repeat, PH and SEC7 domain containing protein secG [Fusarium oxysporum f. sp. cubense race 1]|uniref:Ankyrin repeat, PH and SEC7 domain containing protein secG n=1 Tax=Fusarium oxysporum f. sp. cubense (strain race 1) TaxID=1229664 RepID=N4U9C4_FUSC1|nr:Ankyrin repeat, PH and SEC7 domain containing protein secG [Fusarium oxysporum f. sp. cubense race 1]
MSFTSPTGQFKPHQAFGSGSSSTKPPAQSFSSRVDFSDQSYDMPYFAGSGVSVSNPQTNYASTAPKQTVADAPRGFTLKQLSDAPKTKSFDKKGLSSIPNTSQQAQPSQPLKAKIDYTEFLKSLEFPSIADSKIGHGSGDLIKSQWLVQEALFTKWRTSNGLLWLRGSEGSGKSTLMKQALESCQGPSSIHLTYSFFPSGDETRTRLGLFKSLVRQLVPQAPEAFKGIKDRFEKIQSCLPPKQQVAWNAQELFDELVKVLPKILRTHSVSIYVDGLNYSEGETAPKLVQDFSKLVEKSQIPTKDPATTHGLRIIFSSTPYPMKYPFPRLCIQVDEKNGPSLRRYLEAKLSNIDLNTQRLVSTKAGSSFISARLIVNHIKLFGPGQSSLVQQPSPTPAPISFLLGAYFQDMAHQGSNGLLSLFKWCCLSSGPLSLPDLRVALALDALPKFGSIKELSQMEYFTRFGSDESFQSWIKTTSWGLLEAVTVGGQKVVKSMHDSVSDFFTSKGLDILSYKAQTTGTTTSPLQQAHHSIATCLLRYLAILSKEPRWESMTRTDPALRLAGYAGASWSYHITSAGLGKPEASKILKILGWPSDQTLNVLVKLGLGGLQGTLWTHLFAIYGHAHLLSVAIRKAGNDVLDVQDRQKRTPLHLAALHGHSTVSKQLLKSGAKTNGQAVSGDTALHFAVLQGHQRIMKYLLERDPNLITVADGQSHTPLFSAVFRGSPSAVRLLLDRRADLRALDTYGNSVLHHAVNTEKSGVIKLLLDSGSDVNRQNAQGRTPLHLAIVGDHSSAVKVLLERCSRTDIADNLGRRALHEAVLSGNKACTQLLLKHRVAVDARDNDGQTALVYAIQGRHGSLLKLLLEGGTDINAMDKYGFTMIMVAVQASDEKLTRILLEKNPDLDRLSREGHTVAFYAIFRGKAVSFLSEEEQSIASLLFRRYQKRYQVWHPEWKECQQEFMAKHGKKKDASSKMKNKAKPSKVKNAPLTSNTDAASKPPKSRRSSKVPANIVSKTPSSVPKARADELKRPQEAQGPPKPAPQNEVTGKPQSQGQSQSRPQATANTSAPLAPSNSVPKVSTGVQGNQMTTLSSSMVASVKPGTQQSRPLSSFASYQPPRIPSGSGSGSVSDSKAKEQSSKLPQAPYHGGPSSTSVPAKAPTVQRGSWDIYSSLASGSPAPAQTVQSQKAYVPYPGTLQTSPGASPASAQSFQTFQPFSSVQAQKASPPTAPVPSSQFEKRYSVPSLNSWGQPGISGSASNSPASQNAPAQAYQAFGATSQKPNMSQQQINAPYQKRANPVPAAKPPMPQVIRKPVGGKPAMQAAAEKPTQQSSFLPWQQPQAPAGAKSPPVPIQAQVGTTQSWPSKPHVPAGPAQTPTSKSQAPPRKPPAQGGMPPRKPQAAPGVVQPQMSKPQGQAQAHPPSGNTAPVPPKAQAPPGATQPQVAKPAAVPPKSQTPTEAVQPQTAKPQAQNVKAEPQAHKVQGPSGTSQTPSGKSQGQGGLPSQKPQVPTSKVQSQPAKPSVQGGTSAQKQPAVPKPSVAAPAKPSATSTQPQKATPDQRKPVPSHTGSTPGGVKSPTSIPVQGSSGQKPHQEFTDSYDPNTQQTGTSSMSSGKMAAAAGVGVLAGAGGGYFLSSEIRENYSNPSITDDSSYIHMDAGMSQQSTYDSDRELETHVEFSNHSEEFSESEDEANSINDSGSDGFLSDEEYELSDSEVSGGQASSDDEISDWEESDAESIHEGSDSDEIDLDSPYMSADFTDSEASEAEDVGACDLQAESDSDLNTDPGQASAGEVSESDEKESVNNESEDELDDSVQSMGFQHQSYANQQYQQQGYFNEQYQQPIPEEPESEEDAQPSFQSQYQQQGYFNGQYQQQLFTNSINSKVTTINTIKSLSKLNRKQQQQQGYYGGHQQNQAPEQSESEEEPYQQQYQQQGYHRGQHQQQATQQHDSEDEGQQVGHRSVNYDSDQEVESDQDINNGYSSDEQDQQATSGQYSGGGWGNNYDSDY